MTTALLIEEDVNVRWANLRAVSKSGKLYYGVTTELLGYTPEEVERQGQHGFVREVLKTGKV